MQQSEHRVYPKHKYKIQYTGLMRDTILSLALTVVWKTIGYIILSIKMFSLVKSAFHYFRHWSCTCIFQYKWNISASFWLVIRKIIVRYRHPIKRFKIFKKDRLHVSSRYAHNYRQMCSIVYRHKPYLASKVTALEGSTCMKHNQLYELVSFCIFLANKHFSFKTLNDAMNREEN